jgi:hypothetical protein
MSGKAAGRGDAWADAATRAAVVVAHGGKSVSTDPAGPLELAVLRMVPLANAIDRALRGHGVTVRQPRFELQGWNGELASPVPDLEAELDQIGARYGDIPVVLIGHSMGARAALRVAGHPAVTAVAGLAPWLPPGEPVSQLAGRRVLLAHGIVDRVTPPAQTWAYAERAGAVTAVAAIEVRGGEHTMLWRAPLWHRLAVDFARLSLGLTARTTEVGDAFLAAAAGKQRTVA